MKKELKIEDFMTDSFGRLIHKDQVSEIDKLRDDLINTFIKAGNDLSSMMKQFKSDCLSEIQNFLVLSLGEYGVKYGGDKGNCKLVSFDGLRMIQIQVSDTIIFDERIKAAKELIDICLIKWSKDGTDELKIIINDAFQVDKLGRINLQRILSLRKLAIHDADWLEAMRAINDSLTVFSSKSYFRLYIRKTTRDKWENLILDIASL